MIAWESACAVDEATSLREDGNNGDVPWVEGQDEDNANKVIDHSIDPISFALSHEESKVVLPYFCESWVFQAEEVESEDSDKSNEEDGNKRLDRGWVHKPEEQGDEPCIISVDLRKRHETGTHR